MAQMRPAQKHNKVSRLFWFQPKAQSTYQIWVRMARRCFETGNMKVLHDFDFAECKTNGICCGTCTT